MAILSASVQYNDFKGTSAADRSDHEDLLKALLAEGLANDGEYVVGYKFGFSGELRPKLDGVCVTVYLAETPSGEEPERLRSVEPDWGLADLFRFLKRLDVVLTEHGRSIDKDALD